MAKAKKPNITTSKKLDLIKIFDFTRANTFKRHFLIPKTIKTIIYL